ncbi:stage II sporulation protein M [Parasphingorhabdus cellanae]|uniref:Stage II sporulation protein M n=1 Tax=Parasphingorhabdus cellanae TaxID=2806553 RepID=A0ABX7T2R2_9SPHN|nr:stage II sporulation protein M [Parasphingorhabdus cellanae]QTD55100.1 stage II sporulation protein M [Parasphingorhabdus cellanae]
MANMVTDPTAEQAIENAALKSDRFRLEREADWVRLEDIVTKMEKGKARRLSDDDVLALPTLYRTLLSSLSIARESSLDAGLIDYLEGLALRSYFMVYGTQTSFGQWLKGFFGGGWSQSIREIKVDIWIALFVMIAGTLIGYVLVAGDSDWYYALVPGNFADTRVPGASEAALRETLFSTKEHDGLGVFAAYLFSNNAQVAILAFALGFAFAVPSILLLIHNMALLGAMVWVFAQRDLTVEFIGWLSIHGTTELFAILLAGAAGIHVGRSIAFPGAKSHLKAASDAGKRAALVMAGVVIMLICAGLLEGFARQLINDTGLRYLVGGTMLTFWLVYFFVFGRSRVETGT